MKAVERREAGVLTDEIDIFSYNYSGSGSDYDIFSYDIEDYIFSNNYENDDEIFTDYSGSGHVINVDNFYYDIF